MSILKEAVQERTNLGNTHRFNKSADQLQPYDINTGKAFHLSNGNVVDSLDAWKTQVQGFNISNNSNFATYTCASSLTN